MRFPGWKAKIDLDEGYAVLMYGIWLSVKPAVSERVQKRRVENRLANLSVLYSFI